MVRRSSTTSTRRASAAVVLPVLSHVMESANEREEQATLLATAASQLEEAQRLEAEREARFQAAEKEMMDVLETDGISEHVRKRQLTRLFDRFRYEYTQLSTRFRDTLRIQRKIMDKCLEMKNELVMSAIKIKTAKQLQDEEMKNLFYYREECEHAWKAMSVSEEREKDAVRIIDELKAEIDDLQSQVKALLGMETGEKAMKARAGQQIPPSGSEMGGLSPVRSPLKRLASPTKARASQSWGDTDDNQPRLLSFDEWKLSTRVWSPSSDHASTTAKAPTPSQEELFLQQRKQDIARCVSVPSLQPTAMERASTAVAGGTSPSRRDQAHKAELDSRRATTSVASKRIPSSSQPLPSVSAMRKQHPT